MKSVQLSLLIPLHKCLMNCADRSGAHGWEMLACWAQGGTMERQPGGDEKISVVKKTEGRSGDELKVTGLTGSETL